MYGGWGSGSRAAAEVMHPPTAGGGEQALDPNDTP